MALDIRKYADGSYMSVEGLRDMFNDIRSESVTQSSLLHEIATDLRMVLEKLETYDPRSGLVMVTRQTQTTARNVGAYMHRAAQAIDGAGVQALKAWDVFHRGILGPAQTAERQFKLRPPSANRTQKAFTGVPNPATQRRSA